MRLFLALVKEIHNNDFWPDSTVFVRTYCMYISYVIFQLQKSDKVVVIGGGAVGVELAGEIATEFPQKTVTIIHSRERLIDDRMSRKFLHKVHEGVKAMHINTILGEKVNMDDLTLPVNTCMPCSVHNIIYYCSYSIVCL